MPTYAGKKRAGNHTTIIDEARAVVRFADASDLVTKISPGFIRSTGNRDAVSYKFMREQSGVLAKIHGRSSVQEIRLYSKDATALYAILTATFGQ